MLYKICASLALFCSIAAFVPFANAQSVEQPGNVSALIYSNSAVELFWTPVTANSGQPLRVQVLRNGQSLGQLDSSSLFQSGLQSSTTYTYELRSVAQDGQLSLPVSFALSTANFSSPSQRVYPVAQNASLAIAPPPSTSTASIPPPANVRSEIYSSTALEIFWEQSISNETGIAHRVEVKRNGEALGQLDASSIWQSGLQPESEHSYELRSVAPDGRLSSAVVLELSLASFGSSVVAIVDELVTIPAPAPIPAINPPAVPQNDDVVQTGSNCVARDMSSLLACVRNANAYNKIDFANDIRCGSNCCPNGGAILQLDNINNLTIAGNGRRLLRERSHRQCSLLDIDASSDVQLSNLYLDDDSRVGGCQVADKCPRMVHIKRSRNIGFNNTHISHGKGYTFYVQETNGFTFDNGSLHNSGVLGMYIGHDDRASSNIRITNSVFSDNQTNALALLGVKGGSIGSNIVANNVFARNHRRGQWAVAPRYGSGYTGGGQLYIAQASNVTVRDNIVRDGYCDNCFVQRVRRSGVSGIEVGRPDKQSVSNVLLSGNKVINNDGFAISQNRNSAVNNVQIRNNVLLNNTSGNHVSGAAKSGNQELNIQHFDSFENGSDLGGRFKSAVSCSSGGSVTRRCSAGSRFGQCAVQLSLASADCSGAKAELLGPSIKINAGQLAVASGWVQNPVGRWCLVFKGASANTLGQECKNISDADRSDVQSFVGLPSIEARAPAGSRTVRLQVMHQQLRNSMLLDDLKLAIGG